MAKNVRLATMDDARTLVLTRFEYFKTENWELTPDQKDIMANNLLAYFKRHLNEDFFASLVEVDNTPVSVAFLVISERPANISYPTGKAGVILNVLTKPQYRNKGYAHEAVNKLMEEARKKGLFYLEFPASELGNLSYEKLGFASNISEEYTVMKLALM